MVRGGTPGLSPCTLRLFKSSIHFSTTIVMLSVLLLSGCIQKKSSKFYLKDCNLPTDQSGTINGRWTSSPIPIAFQASAFSSSEIKEMTSAADTWNDFFASSKGYSIINYGSTGSATTSTATIPSSVCSSNIINSGAFTGPIVIYKQRTWPTIYPSDAIALTTYCPRAGTPVPQFSMAFMEINYQSFFSSGRKIPDLQTIVLHELGHVIGLNHSCEKAGRTGMPTCGASSINPDYVSAIMFPVFNFNTLGFGELKQDLGDNDQERANCLYDGSN